MVATDLRRVLAVAYPKCPGFEGACGCASPQMRFEPAKGLFPRGYTGATGRIDEISLVLVVAEPGEPLENDPRQQPVGSPEEIVDTLATGIGETFRDGDSAFHKSVRKVLDYCWPGRSFDEQMKRTWITEGVLCSARVTTGRVHRDVEHECAERYLKRQLALLPNAFVIALGGKATRRLKQAGCVVHADVYAAGKPGCYRKEADRGWSRAGREFQKWLQRRTSGR